MQDRKEGADFNNQFCVFIDILGFKDRMKNFEEAFEYYKRFFHAYSVMSKNHEWLLDTVSKTLEDKSAQTMGCKTEVNSMIFSDSIVLYSEDWKSLLFRVSDVMSYLLSFGFLFRGGIGYGKHYSDVQLGNTYIVSEGLVQAVEIESKISNYPRIVMSQQALLEITKQMKSLYDLNNILIQGDDNSWFINPFFLNTDISDIYKNMKEQINKYSDKKFVGKYIWMKELCEYFSMQMDIHREPMNYYLDTSLKYHFFYPKTFHVGIYNEKSYLISESIYKQTYLENIEQIMQQYK